MGYNSVKQTHSVEVL